MVTGVDRVFIIIHKVVIILLALTVAGDTITALDGRNMYLIGGYLAWSKGGDGIGSSHFLGQLNTVIPGIAHEGDDGIDIGRS